MVGDYGPQLFIGDNMRTWFFFSVPDSKIPSPYFSRFPKMLRYISQHGILKFRLWQGSHDAPIPVYMEEEKDGE
jgi:hypothetical protein